MPLDDMPRVYDTVAQLCQMMACVEQNVPKRVPHFTRRLKQTHVVAIGEDTAGVLCHAVDCEGEPGADGLHAASDRFSILRFDDQMRMVTLERVVHEPKAGPRASAGEGLPNGGDDFVDA